LNHDPTDLCILSCLDYRREPLAPSQHFIIKDKCFQTGLTEIYSWLMKNILKAYQSNILHKMSKWSWGCSSVVEFLSTLWKALDLITSIVWGQGWEFRDVFRNKTKWK
jgi:hypothetical protein